MASKYIKKFKVPEGFEDALNDFAKEILRNQPKDILDFGIQYFKSLEEGKTIDYAHKGENRPENYKPSEKKGPNIVSVENKLEMSKEDLDRLKRSQDKINTINQEIPIKKQVENKEPEKKQDENKEPEKKQDDFENKQPEIKQDEVENKESDKKQDETENKEPEKEIKIQIGKIEQKDQNQINRYENMEQNDEGDKKKDDKYGEWFGRHSSDDLKGKIEEVKNQSEPFETSDDAKKQPYNEWFDKHSSGSKEQGQEKPAQPEPIDGGEKVVIDGNKPPSNDKYGEWFMKHSQEDPKEKYNNVKDEPEPFENIDDGKKIPYDQWFTNNSQDNPKNRSEQEDEQPVKVEEKKVEEQKVEEKKVEEKKVEEKKVEEQQVGNEEGEKFVSERVQIAYEEWFANHSKDGLKIDNVKDEPEPFENIDDVKKVPYDQWFEKYSCKKSVLSEGDGGL